MCAIFASLCEANLATVAHFYFDFRDIDKQNRHNLLSRVTQLSTTCTPCEILSRTYKATMFRTIKELVKHICIEKSRRRRRTTNGKTLLPESQSPLRKRIRSSGTVDACGRMLSVDLYQAPRRLPFLKDILLKESPCRTVDLRAEKNM